MIAENTIIHFLGWKIMGQDWVAFMSQPYWVEAYFVCWYPKKNTIYVWNFVGSYINKNFWDSFENYSNQTKYQLDLTEKKLVYKESMVARNGIHKKNQGSGWKTLVARLLRLSDMDLNRYLRKFW